MKVITQQQTDVQSQLSQAMADRIASNRHRSSRLLYSVDDKTSLYEGTVIMPQILRKIRCCEFATSHKHSGVVGRAYQFAAHPKWQRTLQKAISVSQHQMYTRWVQHIDAMEDLCSLHQSTVACMESICDDGPGLWTPDAVTDARSCLLSPRLTSSLL